MSLMSIGQFAHAARVSVDTLRYYEKLGLVPRAPRRASGYRQYCEADFHRVGLIRRARAVGFSLKEIAELFASRDGTTLVSERTRRLAEKKLTVIEYQLAELECFKKLLSDLVRNGQAASEDTSISPSQSFGTRSGRATQDGYLTYAGVVTSR